jgi:hypothetical protein
MPICYTGYIYLTGAVIWNTLTALYRMLYIKLNSFMTRDQCYKTFLSAIYDFSE